MSSPCVLLVACPWNKTDLERLYSFDWKFTSHKQVRTARPLTGKSASPPFLPLAPLDKAYTCILVCLVLSLASSPARPDADPGRDPPQVDRGGSRADPLAPTQRTRRSVPSASPRPRVDETRGIVPALVDGGRARARVVQGAVQACRRRRWSDDPRRPH